MNVSQHLHLCVLCQVVLTTRLSFDDDGHCKGDEGGKFSLAEANNTSVMPSSHWGKDNIDCVIIGPLQSRDNFLVNLKVRKT